MSEENGTPRLGVVGAGAIGGITAAVLAQSGWNPEVVCKNDDIVSAALDRGLRVYGLKGDHRVRVRAVRAVEDLSGPKDVVLVATKAADTRRTAEDLLPFLTPQSLVVSLQNGMCEEILGEVLGPERVIACVVSWSATMHGPGELELTNGGEFVIGRPAGPPDDGVRTVGRILSAVQPVRVSGNMMGELFSKLIINSCTNTLAVLAGLNLKKLLAVKQARKLFINIMREGMAVARAMGIKVEPAAGGAWDFERYLAPAGLPADLKRHVFLRLVGMKSARIKVSSVQSIERGRRTEIDYLNGWICEKGRAHGVPTPVNDAMVLLTHEIEEGRRAITSVNLNDPAIPSG